MENFNKADYLKFQTNRHVRRLFKHLLYLVEDLNEKGYNISEHDYNLLRKRVLDYGNDCIRELEVDIDKVVK